MLKLKNVSKFYYNSGVVASGFSKLNLELNIGEFVVITGESGSGKSTLLNVISGLDTYEEGEMYINGEETSYYNENDFEDYRKKYIANIFQNFNLINSYTVYQNIELIYILNNIKDKNIKSKIDELLDIVGLKKYRNTKASKLSGGQKQRVAIARALAKDTPIIVADEPTGNLDSKSAREIVELLHKISKNKLVIVVTHNYEQVEKYATRKIRMHDGKILEDVVISKKTNEKYDEKEYGKAKLIDKLRLAFRNTFNIIPKFLLLFVVYLLLCLAVMGEYTSNLKSNYDTSFFGFNGFFRNTDDRRIIVKKKDNSIITDSELNTISNLDNVNSLNKHDALLDTYVNLNGDDDVYIGGKIDSLSQFEGDLDAGSMPLKDDEIVLLIYDGSYYSTQLDNLISKGYELSESYMNNELVPYKLKVVGIKLYKSKNFIDEDVTIYVSDKVLTDCNKGINRNYSNIDVTINKTLFKSNNMYNQYNVLPSSKVLPGKAIVPEDIAYLCNNYYCINNNVKIETSNLYYSDSLDLKISQTYNKKNIENRTGYKDYDRYSNTIFVNEDEYYSMYDKGPYQISIFIKDAKKYKDIMNQLEELGFKAMHVKDNLVDYSDEIRVFTNLIKIFAIVIVLVALFFISYFVIKIILKSRNSYYAIVRMLGASKSDVKTLINIELNTVLNITYILIILSILLVNLNLLNIPYLKDLATYLKIKDYVILYIILFIMSYLISKRYSRSLFKKSAMKTFREV